MRYTVKDYLPSRASGLSKLNSIIPKIGEAYASQRNYDLGKRKHTHVSMLSPWVRHRLILEEELIAAAIGSHGYQNSQKFIQEVFWRTYWKGWLELRPGIWDEYKKLRDEAAHDFKTYQGLQRAILGQTGIDCFDYWVREIQETNYLHNHARMWFASIWIFTLALPWTLGADFFLKHLLDGDPASNTLSWRWVAGLQTPGKIYLARAENIKKFTMGRFNPIGQLATVASPVFGMDPPIARTIKTNPTPKARLRTLLLITEDDLALNDVNFLVDEIVALITLSSVQKRALGGAAEGVVKFAESAIESATQSFNRRLGIPVESISSKDLNAICGLAQKYKAHQIITLRTPVGPGRDLLKTLGKLLTDKHINLIEITRPWDAESWPYATKGFFKFKEAIPSIISKIGLS